MDGYFPICVCFFVEANCAWGVKRKIPLFSFILSEPLAPASVQVLTENATTSTVVIQWIYNHTLTFVESWIVSYTLVNGSIAKQMVPRPDGDSSVVAVIDELVAGYHYEFSLKSVVLDMSSDIVEVNATTSKYWYRWLLRPSLKVINFFHAQLNWARNLSCYHIC